MDNRARLLDALRQNDRPLDDDELSDKAGILPRQQVNQLCRLLEASGLIRRYVGAESKIFNELTDSGATSAEPPPSVPAPRGKVVRVVRPEERPAPICPSCFTTLPMTGRCDACQ